ncbi:hypothetical protein HMPREF1988_01949 [Porphyromonas gingivalis F0185]|nr:hypothetical protein HMPREF1988_01949 [Porphyromonas gingivalis F0185]
MIMIQRYCFGAKKMAAYFSAEKLPKRLCVLDVFLFLLRTSQSSSR